jgi:hypothetical protein
MTRCSSSVGRRRGGAGEAGGCLVGVWGAGIDRLSADVIIIMQVCDEAGFLSVLEPEEVAWGVAAIERKHLLVEREVVLESELLSGRRRREESPSAEMLLRERLRVVIPCARMGTGAETSSRAGRK